MATKNLFEAHVVLHNDVEGAHPVIYEHVFVLARTPAQVQGKLLKALGDKLILINEIRFIGTNEPATIELDSRGTGIKQLVG